MEKHGITVDHTIIVMEFSLDSNFNEQPKNVIYRNMAEEIIGLRKEQDKTTDKNSNPEIKLFPCGLPDIDTNSAYSGKTRDKIMWICSHTWCTDEMCGECAEMISKKWRIITNPTDEKIKETTDLSGAHYWGIAKERGDEIYSKLFTIDTVDDNKPYLSTGQIKEILNIPHYSQAKQAMKKCEEQHTDTRIVEQGGKQIGIILIKKNKLMRPCG